MNLPELLPEELLIGYEGRLRTLNYVPESPSIAAALNRLTPRSSSAPGLQMSFVEMVAEAHGRTVLDVVMNHTLWPYTAAVGRLTSRAAIEAFVVSQAGRTALSRPTRHGAWLCADCVTEDLAFRNLSYWRRNHQLPGAFWCDKHGSPLAQVSSLAMTTGEPHHFAAHARRCDQMDGLALRANRLVSDFTELSVELLAAGAVVDHATTARSIRARAVAQGLVKSGGDVGIALSKLARASAPLTWLAEAFPKITWREVGGNTVISAVCRERPSSVSTAAVLLVASLVSSSTDDALALLVVRPSSSPSPALTR